EDLDALPDLVGIGVAQAHHADLPGLVQLLQRTQRLRVRDRGVGAVVLVEVDGLDAERGQARVAGPAEVPGRAVDVPAAAGGPGVAPPCGGEERRRAPVASQV